MNNCYCSEHNQLVYLSKMYVIFEVFDKNCYDEQHCMVTGEKHDHL